MSDLLKFYGSIVTLGSPESLDPQIVTTIDEKLVLSKKLLQTIELDADGVVPVAFGDLAGANFVVIKASGRVVARVTSLDGATQALPVDPYLVLQCRSRAVTALDLIRSAGVQTTCKVFLGAA